MQWHADLSAADIDVVVSMDVTCGEQHRRRVQLRLEAAGVDMQVHAYTSQEMLEYYPAIRECLARMPPMWRRWTNRENPANASLAWGFHIEVFHIEVVYVEVVHAEVVHSNQPNPPTLTLI